MSKNVLTRDALLGAVTLDIEELSIPELGGVVYVKAMSGKQRDQWESWAVSAKGPKNIRGKAAARCLCDASGNRLFSDSDAGQLGEIKASVLQKIFECVQRLSGVTKEDADELEQASAAGDGGGSSSS